MYSTKTLPRLHRTTPRLRCSPIVYSKTTNGITGGLRWSLGGIQLESNWGTHSWSLVFPP